MLKKYAVLLGITISLALLLLATRYYPGGSQVDKNSIGYDWQNNYLSNLFSERAVNGSANASRPLAVCGMLFLCSSCALFFVELSKKLPSGGSAGIIRYCGAAAMLFAFLAVTPYHDAVITPASALALVSMFYVTVFVFKSKLHWLKVISSICLLVLYGCNYLYYTRSFLSFLPVLQKIALLLIIIWILSLQYLTVASDFAAKGHMPVPRAPL
jgi:hypothetical protein